MCVVVWILLTDVTYLPVSKMSGRVEAIQVLDALRPNTILVTVMLANNETGVIQVSCTIPVLKRHDQFLAFYFYCKIMLISIT